MTVFGERALKKTFKKLVIVLTYFSEHYFLKTEIPLFTLDQQNKTLNTAMI